MAKIVYPMKQNLTIVSVQKLTGALKVYVFINALWCVKGPTNTTKLS